jgi:phosphate transport system substrate-binding protein
VKLWTMLSLAAALAVAQPAQAGAQEVVGSADITGAGSTFAYPIIAKWAKGYQHFVAGGGDFPVAGAGLDDPPAGPVLDYEPVGSLAGTMRIQTGAIDFGASDRPLPSAELRKLGLAQFPLVIGGAVAVVNLDGVEPGQIRFTGPVLADISARSKTGPTRPSPRSIPASSFPMAASSSCIAPTAPARPSTLPTICRR